MSWASMRDELETGTGRLFDDHGRRDQLSVSLGIPIRPLPSPGLDPWLRREGTRANGVVCDGMVAQGGQNFIR